MEKHVSNQIIKQDDYLPTKIFRPPHMLFDPLVKILALLRTKPDVRVSQTGFASEWRKHVNLMMEGNSYVLPRSATRTQQIYLSDILALGYAIKTALAQEMRDCRRRGAIYRLLFKR